MRLLVPLDVRGCAEAVVERALWLARLSPHARVDLLTVVPAPLQGQATLTVGQHTHMLGGTLEDETLALLRGYALLFDKIGALGDVLARNDEPAPAIIALCRERMPTLVVMGSHARTGLKRAVFGSVAETVLRHAGCACLIEPAGQALTEHPAGVLLQAEAERAG
jgi:nucleotide-binding universal stress UspA family protein